MTNRSSLRRAVVGALLTGTLVTIGAAPAHAATVLSFRESDKGGKFTFVDAAPKQKKSKDGFPTSFGTGDAFVNTTPLTSDANKRIGTLTAHCDVVKGGRFDSGILDCTGVFRFHGGTLFALAQFAGTSVQGTVVGGTGTYAGARGTFASKEHKTYTQDTVTLLP